MLILLTSIYSTKTNMRFLAKLIGSTIGGWIGWTLGSYVGIMTAFVVSTIGSVVGWYYAGKWTEW